MEEKEGNELTNKAKEKLLEQVFGKDTTRTNNPRDSSVKKKDSTLNKIKNLFTKPKKPATDTARKN